MKLADPEVDWDEYILSTGRKFYANNGIVGISPDLRIYEGYDGGPDDKNWSPEERRELADFMIGLWQRYKEAV